MKFRKIDMALVRTRFLVVVIVVVCKCSMMNSVHAQQFEASKLAVEWKLVQNKYQGNEAFEAMFVLHNKSAAVFPAKGWRLYFSYPRTVLAVPGQEAELKTINGEFCSLYPTAGFKEIQPGATADIRYIGKGKSFSYTDAPSGLFIVWEDQPGKAHPIPQYTINAVPDQEFSSLRKSPQVQFERNARIAAVAKKSTPIIIPTPVQLNNEEGIFHLDRQTTISCDPFFANEAALFQSEMEKILGVKLQWQNRKENHISFKKVVGLAAEEYRLSIHRQGILVEASFQAGAFYAIQSIKQLLPAEVWAAPVKSMALKALSIQDQPRFSYRSLMLDVARNFQTRQEILKVIDLLALYKINTLHFHLTDDEGWRLEIPTLPELTSVGATRGYAISEKNMIQPAYGSGAEPTAKPGSGYYTRADFIEILKYATARHIKVIPELETPGHARAAIKAMQSRYHRLSKEGKKEEAVKYLLHDTTDRSVYKSVQGYTDNVMNVALPSVYTFIEEVVDQVQLMYKEANAPLSTIHIGGDEVPAGVWQQSPAALDLMKREQSITTTDDFWYYYLSKVSGILEAKKMYLSGWEEVAMRKTKLDGKSMYIPNPDFPVRGFHTYVWNNVWGWGMEDLTYRLANAGYKVVMSPVTNFYFDLAYEKDADEPGLYWGGYVNEETPYYFNPYDYYTTAKETLDGKKIDRRIFDRKERLTDYGKSNIVGVQAQIWAEKITSAAALEYMLAPKIIGFAERAWAQAPAWVSADSSTHEQLYQEAWGQFVHQMADNELPKLDYYAGGFQYRIPPPGVMVRDGLLSANSFYSGFKVHYTTDGSEPSEKSPVYQEPFKIQSKVKLATFNKTGRKSRTVIIQQPE